MLLLHNTRILGPEGKGRISWKISWETNQTSDVPVMRVSTDKGKTFGEIIKLSANGPMDKQVKIVNSKSKTFLLFLY